MNNREWMIRNEVLDSVLSLFMSFDVPLYKEMLDKINPPIINMDFVAKTLSQYDWEDWMKDSFKSELLHKKFLEEDKDGNLSITEVGREYKRKGGYNAIDKKEKEEDIIREKQVENLNLDIELKKFNKRYNQKFIVGGFIILILNFVITLMTLQSFNKENVIEPESSKLNLVEKNEQILPEKETPQLEEVKTDSLTVK